MTTATRQHALVTRALERLATHVRVRDQGLALDGDALAKLVAGFPPLVPFGASDYIDVWAVLDWDHRLPSHQLLLRVFAIYDEARRRQLDDARRAIDEQIADDNLFPEFDLPDYGELAGDELYVASYDAKEQQLGDLVFSSPWRRQVPAAQLEATRDVLENSKAFTDAMTTRGDNGLGNAMLVGWVPPSMAKCERWALEFWLLMRFDGSTGEANVFVVDPDGGTIVRNYVAEVQAS